MVETVSPAFSAHSIDFSLADIPSTLRFGAYQNVSHTKIANSCRRLKQQVSTLYTTRWCVLRPTSPFLTIPFHFIRPIALTRPRIFLLLRTILCIFSHPDTRAHTTRAQPNCPHDFFTLAPFIGESKAVYRRLGPWLERVSAGKSAYKIGA